MLRIIQRFFPRKKQETDSIVFIIVLDLAAVMVWRGAWGLMDVYLFPLHQELSFLFSLIMGLVIFAFLKLYTKER